MPNTTILMRAQAAVAVLGLMAACASQAQNAGSHAQAAGNSAAVLDFRSCAKPMYPHAELKAQHEGTVKLGFLVKADGSVADTKVVASTGFPALDEEARSALAKCRFRAATRDGQPIETWADIQYVWKTK